MGSSRGEVAVGSQFERGAGCGQVLIQVGFLAGQGTAEPLGKDLMMAVAERAIGDFAAHNLAERRVRIIAGERIA
jgi:hypothetical protein